MKKAADLRIPGFFPDGFGGKHEPKYCDALLCTAEPSRAAVLRSPATILPVRLLLPEFRRQWKS